MEKPTRVTLTISPPQNEIEQAGATLLMTDSRKKSELVMIAVGELMEKYHLGNSSEDILAFVSNYSFFRTRPSVGVIISDTVSTPDAPKPVAKTVAKAVTKKEEPAKPVVSAKKETVQTHTPETAGSAEEAPELTTDQTAHLLDLMSSFSIV